MSYKLILSVVLTVGVGSGISHAQVIGSCEGCEAVLEFGEKELRAIDTLPEFESPGQQIKITGTVYKPDGSTPAPGVILYVYHTNEEGVYPTRGNERGWARRHGYIRSWLKTDDEGMYTFYTQKPGSYSSEAAHIHITILEPDGRYYWLGSYLFRGDPNLREGQLNQISPRGGSDGILDLKEKDGLWVGERDIILGKNVPGYR